MSPRTTPLYVAQEQGIFTKYGLDPKIVLVCAAATLVATLVSGEMDVGYTGGTSVLGAAGQGSYLKILSSISNTLTHSLVAHPSVKRAEDLRGKRFGIRYSEPWRNYVDQYDFGFGACRFGLQA